MKKLLILFAAGFPYNISEPFLEQEYPLYPDYFDQVLLITSCKRGEMPTRSLNDSNITVLRDHTVHGDLLHILSALPRTLTDPMLYRELRLLLGKKQFSFAKLREMLVFSLCANHRVKLALRWLRKHPDCAPAAIYSYWLHIPAYAAVRLKQRLKGNCFTVSRAHGFDLYLERRESCYIPYHNQVFDALDEVASISEDGQHYLQTHYGHSEKVCVHRLGASDYGCHNPCVGRRTLRIVTCARTIPLKRLDRLVDALRQIPDRAIHWTHIGSGEAQENLERYAASQLPPNITAEFTGRIPNAQIYETYRSQPFHVFVNLSESEGAGLHHGGHEFRHSRHRHSRRRHPRADRRWSQRFFAGKGFFGSPAYRPDSEGDGHDRRRLSKSPRRRQRKIQTALRCRSEPPAVSAKTVRPLIHPASAVFYPRT